MLNKEINSVISSKRYGPTYNAIACNLEVFLGQRSLMEVTVKVTGCSERTRKNADNLNCSDTRLFNSLNVYHTALRSQRYLLFVLQSNYITVTNQIRRPRLS